MVAQAREPDRELRPAERAARGMPKMGLSGEEPLTLRRGRFALATRACQGESRSIVQRGTSLPASDREIFV